MKNLLSILFLVAFTSSVFAANTYKWVDKEGQVNFTDDLNKVPAPYRNQAEVIKEDAAKENISSPASSPKGGEVGTEVYGQGEAYWKRKLSPWRERLREAEANYDKAHQNFMQKAMELSKMRYGSRTQYKMKIIELDTAKEEMMKYQAQIVETDEMLEKISKEAKEAKANPDWLK